MKGLKLFGIALVTFILFGVADAKAAEVGTAEELTSCLKTKDATCTLSSDIVLPSYVYAFAKEDGKYVKSNVTLDLNGHSIKPADDYSYTGGLIIVWESSVLTVKGNGSIDSGKNVKAAIQVSANAGLVVDGGIIKGASYGIAGNGTEHNTSITVNGGTIEGGTTGIYHPQNGTLIVNGGTIEGLTGIEIRAGELNVNGGQIIGNGVPTEVTANGNGTTTTGAGIAVVQHTTKLPIDVNITKGSIKGYTALYEANIQGNDDASINKVNINVTGGNFEAINDGKNAVYSEDVTDFIGGGTFNTGVSKDYIADGYGLETDANGNVTVNKENTTANNTNANSTKLDDVPKTSSNFPFVLASLLLLSMGAATYTLKNAKTNK